MNTENTKIERIDAHGSVAALCALLRESSELEVRTVGRRIAEYYGMVGDDHFIDLGNQVVKAIAEDPSLVESVNVGIRLHRWKCAIEEKSGKVIARPIVD